MAQPAISSHLHVTEHQPTHERTDSEWLNALDAYRNEIFEDTLEDKAYYYLARFVGLKLEPGQALRILEQAWRRNTLSRIEYFYFVDLLVAPIGETAHSIDVECSRLFKAWDEARKALTDFHEKYGEDLSRGIEADKPSPELMGQEEALSAAIQEAWLALHERDHAVQGPAIADYLDSLGEPSLASLYRHNMFEVEQLREAYDLHVAQWEGNS